MTESGRRMSEDGRRMSEEARNGTRQIGSADELDVYRRAYALAMEIFTTAKGWPREEQYSLTDQIRRSSRSVCANLKEECSPW